MDRRIFLKSLAAAGAAASLPFEIIHGRPQSRVDYLGLHPFLSAHADAVFIMKTTVSDKTDTAAKLAAGQAFASKVFMKSDTPGVPFDWNISLKANLTCTSGTGGTAGGMGIRTDIPFVEGVIESVKGLGFPADNVSMREGNLLGDGYCPAESEIGAAREMAERAGINFLAFASGRKAAEITLDTIQEGSEAIWTDCPDGIMFRRIGSVAPFNAPKTWLLNIAKFKAHSMGLTLASKNIQGACISPYIHFCETLETTKKQPPKVLADFNPDFEQRIGELYQQHAKSIPRWQRPGTDARSGFGMESWAQRTCDWLSVQPAGLHVIEGIYGRNGNGFTLGPGPGDTPEEFMSNILIFGMNPLLVDVIGMWMGGHEPGNFGLFHIARERGLLSTFNPRAIPVFAWEDNEPSEAKLDDFERTPLRTPYLQKDYNGGTEELYHLVNEPFDYGSLAVSAPSRPDAFVLGQNHSNPFRGSTIIEYRMPRSGYARLEIFDSRGDRVGVLTDGWVSQGAHAATWVSGTHAPGAYFYRFMSGGTSVTRKMVLVR